MGCKQCQVFGEKQKDEIVGETLNYESSVNRGYVEHCNNSLSKEVQMEYQKDLDSTGESIQEFRTRRNDIKKFKKQEIIEQATRISQEFLARPDRSQLKLQFDSGNFEKGLMRLVQFKND
jgi:hypothetical protein